MLCLTNSVGGGTGVGSVLDGQEVLTVDGAMVISEAGWDVMTKGDKKTYTSLQSCSLAEASLMAEAF